jgi:hypothetical protein
VLALALFVGATTASADNFSFTGSFTSDDNVQLFTFSVGSTSLVTLLTTSYAGGVNAAGQTIPQGGFDPILALFSSSGALVGQNDDGDNNVPADSVTGEHFDTFLQTTLAPGTYTVSVMEFDNFANGPNLSNGFARAGLGNFTASGNCAMFQDVDGSCRTGNWAFDILGVGAATEGGGGGEGGGGNAVPEPSSFALLFVGLVCVGFGLKARNLQMASLA